MKAAPSKLDQHAERIAEWCEAKQPLRWIREQLAADGLSVSLSQLSRWWSRWQQRQERERVLDLVNDWTEEMEALYLAYDPTRDRGKARQFVTDLLIRKGAATEDNKLSLDAARLQLQEESARTKAELEREKIELAKRRVTLLEKKLAEVKDVAESQLTAEEQRARLKEILK